MPLSRILGFGLSVVIVVTVFASTGSAQIKRPLRWLGQGFSDGYHRCNPGPDSDYYNPYSDHNTYLVHQYGATNAPAMNSYRAPGTGRGSVPFSVYAIPAPATGDPTLTTLPAEVDDNSFIPGQPVGQPRTDENWQTPPGNTEPPADIKRDSALAPQLKNRIRQRSANALVSPNRFSIGNR